MKIGFEKVFISVPILSLFSKFFFCWKAGVFVIIFLMEKISNSHFLVFKEHQHSMTFTIFFHLQSEHKRQIFFFQKIIFLWSDAFQTSYWSLSSSKYSSRYNTCGVHTKLLMLTKKWNFSKPKNFSLHRCSFPTKRILKKDQVFIKFQSI